MDTRLTIITGPQGSGNHLFSKALGQNKYIFSWPELQTKYWQGHDLEPFAQCWKDPTNLKQFDWTLSRNYVTSISCPYFDDGVETIPDYKRFSQEACRYADVKFVVIGRDQNILELQQQRVRGKITTPVFEEQLEYIVSHHDTIFASQELLYLYRINYLNWLEKQIGVKEITKDADRLSKILHQDANTKYVSQAQSDLDETIKRASAKKGS